MPLARLQVDLNALRANYRLLAEAAPRLAAVAKADGYGLGAAPVARALRLAGCADFFVATVEEGASLRAEDAASRIFVFAGPHDSAAAAAMAANRLTPVINDAAQVERWRPHRQLPAAVHVDTGMNRLGFSAEAAAPERFKGLAISVLLSHLANADDPAHPANAAQIERFAAVAARFPGVPTSLGGSGAVLIGARSDLPRAGIALYGGNPFAARRNPMLPVASLQARVLALRTLGAGEPVGYGGVFETRRKTCVAVLGAGYADGVPRGLRGAEAAFAGTRLPVIGRVSMDLMHVDATAVAERIGLGDWVEIFGQTVRLDETAGWAGTIGYDVLAGVGARVARCYVGE